MYYFRNRIGAFLRHAWELLEDVRGFRDEIDALLLEDKVELLRPVGRLIGRDLIEARANLASVHTLLQEHVIADIESMRKTLNGEIASRSALQKKNLKTRAREGSLW